MIDRKRLGWALVAGIGTATVGRFLYRRARELDLKGKVALITGGSRGLGFVLAQEFASHGARVAICARDIDELKRAKHALEEQGAEVLALRCDVGHKEEVDAMVQEILRRMQGIDVLVNNAGIIQVGPLENQTLEDFHEAMDVMFWGVVHPTLAVLPQMRKKRAGRIVNITSIGGRMSVPHLVPYSSAKFAAVGFSEGLRAECAKHGIMVTTVAPGLMRTGSHLNAYFKGQNQKEFAWFSLGASLPLVSIEARRAARKIVEAVKHGESDLVITPQAKLAVLLHGVAPGLTSDVLSLVDRLLPRAGGIGERRRKGKESASAVSKSGLTKAGRRAAERYNEIA
jgi:NAD(P)-dependent dehydrogenase (short-subunit alcohol dehydrogenase family)